MKYKTAIYMHLIIEHFDKHFKIKISDSVSSLMNMQYNVDMESSKRRIFVLLVFM